jgi:hypothetical protein
MHWRLLLFRHRVGRALFHWYGALFTRGIRQAGLIILVWIATLTVLFTVTRHPCRQVSLDSVKAGFFVGVVTFFAMQPPDSLDKLSTPATVVSICGMIGGFFHLGLLASFLSTRFGRR